MTFYSGNSFFLFLSSSFFFSVPPPTPSPFPLLSTFLACGPDWSSSNAISLVQRLSFGENEGVVKHLGMIYLSLDHSVPTYPYLFSLSLAIFWKKNLCPFTGSTLSIRYFFQDKSSSIKHQLLFDIDINQLAKLYRFRYIFAIFCYLVNNDFIFISKIEREREMGKILIYSFDYYSISGYESLSVSSMYPYWSAIIPLSVDTRLTQIGWSKIEKSWSTLRREEK